MAQVVDILKSVGAVITESHFVLTTGRHSGTYINKDALYSHPIETSKIGELFAQKYKDAVVGVVAGPALGGIILSQWTAYHLTKLRGHEVQGVYTEKTSDKRQVFTRGYDKIVKGQDVLIVEDLTTTGGSVKKVVEAVNLAGGRVAGVCVMVNRDPERVTSESVGASFDSLDELVIDSHEEADCPLCKKNIPLNTDVGHGRAFLEHKKKRFINK